MLSKAVGQFLSTFLIFRERLLVCHSDYLWKPKRKEFAIPQIWLGRFVLPLYRIAVNYREKISELYNEI